MLWGIKKQNNQSHTELTVFIVFKKWQHSLGENLRILRIWEMKVTLNSHFFFPLYE